MKRVESKHAVQIRVQNPFPELSHRDTPSAYSYSKPQPVERCLKGPTPLRESDQPNTDCRFRPILAPDGPVWAAQPGSSKWPTRP